MLDVERFIVSVQKRPTLYDAKSADYSNRKSKEQCWAEVGEELYEDWNEISTAERNQRVKEQLTKKWKAIRDNFVRDYRVLNETGALKKKKYMFYDQLTFLAPYLKNSDKNESSDFGESQGKERVLSSLWDDLSSDLCNENQPEISVISSGDIAPETQKRKKKRAKRSTQHAIEIAPKIVLPDIQETAHSYKEECNPDKYGNRGFLLSYLPIMDSLPQHTQLHARMLITQVFFDLQAQTEAGESD